MNHKKLGLTFLIAFLIISNSINSITLFSQIRVMPLGDATVIGTGSTNNVGGFRDDLHLFLNAGLMPFDFVGTQNDGVSTDPDHEGHAASTVNDINQDLLSTIQLYQPHIVIVHLGTEDLIANGNVGTVFNGLSSVIDNISNYSSETEIYLSSLIPSRDQVVNSNIDGLNLQLQTLVDTKSAQGISVYFVDINTAFTEIPSWSSIFMSDDYFPNDEGYGRMADVILNKLNSSSRYIASESFADNFNNRFFLGPNWTTHPNYRISNNELRNSSNQDTWDNYLAVINSVASPNTITFKYSLTSDELGRSETGVVFLLNSSSIDANGFLLTLNNGSLKLWELIDGKVGSNLASESGLLPMPQSGNLFFMNWSFNSPELRITVKINNTLFGELTHTTTPPGANEVRYAGIMLKGSQNNNIDDFSISSVVDKKPPAAISDFALVRIGSTSAQFDFTATGDDSLTGTASNYDLRFSTDPIIESNFEQATAAIVSQTPNEQGTDESVFITGLEPKTDYYFAIKAIDENNNASPISDGSIMGSTVESVQFDEDFNRTELGEQWQTSDDVVISEGALKTANSQSGWKSAAVLISPTSPIELGFNWLNISSQSEIDKIGLLVMLQEPTTTANGYMIRVESSTNEFQLWTVDQGNPLQKINSFKYHMDLVSGSTLKVFTYSTETSHDFVIFVDSSFNGVLSDNNKLFGNSQVQYCGLIFQGNSSVAADNFFVISLKTIPASISVESGDDQDGILNQLFPDPLVVKVNDDLGSPVYAAKIKYEIIEGDARLIPPLNPSGTIRIEAEDGIIEGNSFIVDNASNTSGGSYINTVAGESDTSTVVYDFYIDQDGIYKIWGRVLAPSGTEDSFFIQVDDFNEILWDVWQGNQKSAWDWDLVSSRGSGSVKTSAVDPYEINLNKGFHKLILRNRDINTKLDRLIITRDLTFQPSGFGGNPLYFSNYLGLSEAFVLLNSRSGDISIKAFLFDVPELDVIFNIRALPNTPVAIAEFSGNNQTGPAGQVLTNPLVVLASDDFGNPTPNVSVLYELVEGGGRIIENQPVLTDEDGKAAVDLELGKSETNNRVLAHANGLNGSPVEFLSTATSGIPTQIEFVSGSNQGGEIGSTLPEPFVIRISDQQNSPIENYPVVFNIASNLGGSLSADTVLTNSEGKAQVSFTFGNSIGNYSIHAIALGLLDSPIVFSVSATHGPAFQLRKVSGDSIAGISNFPLVEPFVAEVSDEFGNPVKNISVLFKIISGDGIFAGGLTQLSVTTDSLGEAGVILTLGSDMSEFAYRVQASSDGLQGPVEFVATAVSPTAYKITLVDGDSLVGIINKPLDAPFRVRVTNPINEPIKNHPVTFKVIAGGGLFVDTVDLSQTTPTDEDGIASATLRMGSFVGEGSNLVHASGLRGSLLLVGSPVVFTASGKFDAEKISIIKGNNQIGVIDSQLPQPIEVLVLNSNDNPVAGIPVEFQVISGGGTFDNNSDTTVVKNTNSNGNVSVIFTLGKEAGINNNQIRVTASDGFVPLQGSPISIMASAAESPAIKIEAITQTQLTGIVGKVIEPVQVKVVDSANLPVPSHEVKFRIITGNGRITNAQHDTSLVVSTNESGIAEISWILGTKIGTDLNKIEATSDNGILDLIQSPITFNATTLPDLTDPDSSEIHVTSPTIADGRDKATITIILRDQYNNPIAGKEVFLSATGELNFFEQPLVTDNAGQTVGHMTSLKSGKKTIHARNVDDNIELNSKAVAEFISTTANQIKLQDGNAQTRNVGTVLANPIVVSVTDMFDNPVPNYPVTFTSQTTGGYFKENQPVLTDSKGFASIYYILSESEGTNIIEAIADGLTGNPIIFSVSGVRNPVVKILSVSGDLQTGIVGDTLNQPLIVETLDANDDPVMDVPVSFQFSAGSGSFVEPQPILSDAFGKASTKPILGPELITQVISAKSSLVQGVSLTFFANTAPSGATQIDLHSGDNQVIRPLEQSTSMTIITRDTFHNPVSGTGVMFEVIEGDAIIITAQPVVSNSSGLASTIIQAKTTPGIAKIAASLVKNPAEKVVFTVQISSSVAHNIILVSGDQQIGTKGYYLSEPLVVKVTDIYNNPVPNEPVAFVVSDGEATVEGDSIKLTNDEGIAKSQLRVGENATQIEALAFAASLPNEVLSYHITAIENEIPLIVSSTPDLQVRENEFVSFDISVIDPESDPVNVEVNELPDGAVVTKVNAVSWRFDWTPNFGQSGEHPIAYSVADNRGGVVKDTVLIKVINVNRPPMITNVHPAGDTTIIRGRSIEFSLKITDPDEEELTYIWELNDVEVSQSVSFVYESNPNFSGQDIVEVFVSDSEDTVSFKWFVTVIVSVELVQFNAQADLASNTVLLHWKTTFESDNLGFDILRSKQKDLGYKKINSQLIPPNLDGNYEFLDEDIIPGFRYYYKLLDKNIQGFITEHGPVQVWFQLPSYFQLDQNFPNPLALKLGQTNTVIQFHMPAKETVTIHIFNTLGQLVLILANKTYEPGIHRVSWDGKDRLGNLVPSGIYYYKFSSDNHHQIKRMILIR